MIWKKDWGDYRKTLQQTRAMAVKKIMNIWKEKSGQLCKIQQISLGEEKEKPGESISATPSSSFDNVTQSATSLTSVTALEAAYDQDLSKSF